MFYFQNTSTESTFPSDCPSSLETCKEVNSDDLDLRHCSLLLSESQPPTPISTVSTMVQSPPTQTNGNGAAAIISSPIAPVQSLPAQIGDVGVNRRSSLWSSNPVVNPLPVRNSGFNPAYVPQPFPWQNMGLDHSYHAQTPQANWPWPDMDDMYRGQPAPVNWPWHKKKLLTCTTHKLQC